MFGTEIVCERCSENAREGHVCIPIQQRLAENRHVNFQLRLQSEVRELAKEMPEVHKDCIAKDNIHQIETVGFDAGTVEGRSDLRDEILGLLADDTSTFDSLEEANEFLSELLKLLKEKR